MNRLLKRAVPLMLLLGSATLYGNTQASLPSQADSKAADDLWSPVTARGRGDSLKSNSDFSVLTYNVKGLPWPLGQGRTEALEKIADRLKEMRKVDAHPDILVMQEAFTAEAKAVGINAGYRYRSIGPAARPSAGTGPDGDWYLGETSSARLDSGLVIFSDYPIHSVRKAAFPQGACAGFDCLAAKGVLLVTVAIPQKGLVTIATTHLNSRKASGAPIARTHDAYHKQAQFVGRFIEMNRRKDVPMILAGDFNRGQRVTRVEALVKNLGSLNPTGLKEALRECIAQPACNISSQSDAATIRNRGKDMQFLFSGNTLMVAPVATDITFGTEADNSTLSDHLGFTIHYRFTPFAAQI